MPSSKSRPQSNADPYYSLDSRDTDPARMKKERDKAQKLKKSQGWKNKIHQGLCHYCQKKFKAGELTMDHIVPLARGGISSIGNCVPACKDCNRDKKLSTPVDLILEQLKKV